MKISRKIVIENNDCIKIVIINSDFSTTIIPNSESLQNHIIFPKLFKIISFLINFLETEYIYIVCEWLNFPVHRCQSL